MEAACGYLDERRRHKGPFCTGQHGQPVLQLDTTLQQRRELLDCKASLREHDPARGWNHLSSRARGNCFPFSGTIANYTRDKFSSINTERSKVGDDEFEASYFIVDPYRIFYAVRRSAMTFTAQETRKLRTILVIRSDVTLLNSRRYLEATKKECH